MFKHLRVKLTALYAALFAAALVAIAVAVYAAAGANAERLGRDQLAASGEAFDRILATRNEGLRNGAEILSLDFGFRAAVATQDAATVRSALTNLIGRLGLNRAYVVGLDGQATAQRADFDASLPQDVLQAVMQADEPTSGLIRIDGKVYEAVVTPILIPTLSGWVVFVRALGPEDLRELEQLSAIPVRATILGRKAGGGLEWFDLGRSRAVDPRMAALVTAAANSAHVETLQIPGEGEALVYGHRLASLGQGQETLVLRYPTADALRPLEVLFREIIALGLAGILLVIVASWLIARSVTRPLSALAEVARRLQTGDSAARVAFQGEDEVAAVGAAFNTMADAVAEREVSLMHAKERAEAADRIKSEFLANMNHELRTPLNGLLEPARMLHAMALDEGQRRIVELIKTSGEGLQRILNNVMDVVELSSGDVRLLDNPFDLGAVLNGVSAEAGASARAKGLVFTFNGAGVCGWARGDSRRVSQVLTSLLDNAVKFTAKGEVALTAEAAATGWRFTVRDTGQGFDPEQTEALFELFQQADASMTRSFGGAGLGLSVARDLARAMGGDITAEGVPDRGATFTVTLPLPQAEAPPVKAMSADAAPSASDAGVDEAAVEEAPLRILLAEDNPANRTVVQMILGAVGVELTSTENGAEAVEAYKTGAFDAVLMDLQMPVMDGLTAIRLIREAESATGRRTPIVVLSANVQAEHQEASAAAGADLHIAKPILANVLLGALEDALAHGYPEAA